MEVVPLADVKEARSALYKRSFTAEESAELSGKHVQTTAGFLALKRAFLKLLSSLYNCTSISEKDVKFTHDEKGAPRLVSLPDLQGLNTLDLMKRLHLSISHTKIHACGLVVLQEDPSE